MKPSYNIVYFFTKRKGGMMIENIAENELSMKVGREFFCISIKTTGL